MIQEHWTRARVLLYACKLPFSLWSEAINHGNWLRNRCPSERIRGKIPLLQWDPESRIDFSLIPAFGQPGYAFIYRSSTVPHKKFIPRSHFAYFVRMKSDTTIMRIFLPDQNSISFCRVQDFHPQNSSALPNVNSFLDGISRQRELEAAEDTDQENTEIDHLIQAHSVILEIQPSTFISKKTAADPSVPSSFSEACKDPSWRESIDREYNALVKRKCWRLIPRTSQMRPVPYTWAFRIKPLDAKGTKFLKKSRCCLRGDKQKPFIDFNPEEVYAPVASHEALRALFAYAA